VIIVTTKGQLTEARAWADNILPDLYTQNILDKLDVMTLKNLVPRRLDKPMITAASYNYTKQLQQCTSLVTTIPTKQNSLNHPPHSCSRIIKPADITYAEATRQTSPSQKSSLPNHTTTVSAPPAPQAAAPFDYQATLDRITKDVETTLTAKFDAAIANLQKSFTTLEQKVDQKLQQHLDLMKNSQADKATQDNHTK